LITKADIKDVLRRVCYLLAVYLKPDILDRTGDELALDDLAGAQLQGVCQSGPTSE
jgi:hypothetical protein